MDIDQAKANGRTNLPHLVTRQKSVSERLAKLKAAELDEVRLMFEALVLADFNAADLEQELSGSFGFAEHDARYLRSLRDQMGSGRALTKQQLLSLRVVLQNDHYIYQLALLM